VDRLARAIHERGRQEEGIRLGGSPSSVNGLSSSVKGLSLDQRHGWGVREEGVMTATEGIVVLLGRVLFAVFFVRSGIAHVRKHEGMTGYARSAGLPFPGIGGWPAGVWLLAGAASIALGIWAEVGSLMIALFLVLAALYFHRFWTIRDEGQRQTQASNFYRNVALLGASLALWGFFVAAGEAVRFTLTGPLF